jgi:hypothetical protein
LRDSPADANAWNADAPRFFERTTADGHRIRFGLNVQVWHDRPRFIGWATLGVLLLLTGLAYARAPHAAPAGRHSGRCAALWRG